MHLGSSSVISSSTVAATPGPQLVSFPDPPRKEREGQGDSLTFLISAQECMRNQLVSNVMSLHHLITNIDILHSDN